MKYARVSLKACDNVRAELSMLAACLPPATLTDIHHPAPSMIRPEST